MIGARAEIARGAAGPERPAKILTITAFGLVLWGPLYLGLPAIAHGLTHDLLRLDAATRLASR